MRLSISISCILLLAGSVYSEDFCVGNYKPTPVTSIDTIYAEYAGSILHMSADGREGTAYVVDTEGGYALTAAHVVQDEHTWKDAASIRGQTIAIPGKEFTFEIVKALSPSIDLALIRLSRTPAQTSTAFQGRVKPLDISLFGVPFRSGYTISYPKEFRVNNGTPDVQTATIKRNPEKLRFTVAREGLEGDSGSPLLDTNGQVVGTCIKVLDKSSFYIASLAAFELLKKVPLTSRARDFDSLLQGSGKYDEVDEALQSKSTNCSNVELIAWSQEVKANLDRYRPRRDLFKCPISLALEQRDLQAVEHEISSLIDSATYARASLALGEAALKLGDHARAATYLAQADVAFGEAIQESTASFKSRGDGAFAYLWAERSRSLLKHADATGDVTFAERSVHAAARSAINAANTIQKAMATALFGEAKFKTGDAVTSAMAYARAKQLGYDVPWLDGNWLESAGYAVDQGSLPKSVLDKGIAAAPKLKDSTLAKAARFGAQM